MAPTAQHREWLNLIDVSGPFLSPLVLNKTFPQGLEAHQPRILERLRIAYGEWEEWKTCPTNGRDIHLQWVRFVLREILEHPDEVILEGQAIPSSLEVRAAEYGEILRPDIVIANPPGDRKAGRPRVLVQIFPPDQELESRLQGSRWTETPAGRMAILLRGLDVRLGLITNGDHWMLVNAARGETTGYISWYSWLWLDEHITLRAFRAVLGPQQLFGVSEPETLESLLDESAEHQQEVTEQLGLQVRRAVEILVQALDKSDREFGGDLLHGIEPERVYEAAVTFMMRLVFLFCAEERDLLPLEDEQYAANYAASTLGDQLREVADRHGEEVLERRMDAWQRLLATFRAVHAGVDHEDLRLPAYGGHLFDPDRFPFLEGRPRESEWEETAARPLPINNRTVLHLLSALQVLQDSKTGEAQRLSFRSLDIEQIGHVYEGLLDHTAERAKGPVLSLKAKSGSEPEIELSRLEELWARSEKEFEKFVKGETGRKPSAVRKDMQYRLAEEAEQHRFAIACENNDDLYRRVAPFAGLVRWDTYEYPVVIPENALYVTEGADRRSTGTHYTPKSLTEPIVQYTLEPLVYEGPAEGKPGEEWKLRSASEILDLRVCDMACGSAAFLVQACRYLSERLVEAWEKAESRNPGKVIITPEGKLSEARPSECLIPREDEERLVLARRLVADRCLYGVDINPMAVEMAKLSLWLITLQKDRPFTFLDHAIKCGDSLLGVTSLEQIETLDPRPGQEARQIPLIRDRLREAVRKASDLRRKLEEFTVLDIRDAEEKKRLLEKADQAMETLELVADAVIASAVHHGVSSSLESELKGFSRRLQALLESMEEDSFSGEEVSREIAEIQKQIQELMNNGKPQGQRPRQSLHWPLEFPEVFEGRKGFDAFLGNPPFQGGQKITGTLGTDYRNHLVEYLAGGQRGSADLCAYFFLRAHEMLRPRGCFGLLATNTIAQGDTREVGLELLEERKANIYRAVPSRKWPGGASLEVAHVWIRKGNWEGDHVLEEEAVRGISPFLSIPGRVKGKPYRLAANANKSFQGSIVLGMGFVLQPEEAQELIERDPKNKDVLFPYLNGQDLNSRPDQSPSRWVINFFDWPLERSASGSWERADEPERKKWLRSGRVPSDYPDPVARDYPECIGILEEKVKPERMKNNRKVYRDRWWQYAEKRPDLVRTIADLDRVLITAQTARRWAPAFQPANIVFSHSTIVFPLQELDSYSVLQSVLHEEWRLKYGPSLRLDARYTPSDCFDTFPFPSAASHRVGDTGRNYHRTRHELTMALGKGMTTIYNMVHDSTCNSAEIEAFRDLVATLDLEVIEAYGWQDLQLRHGFHNTEQGVRWTVHPVVRIELLDRLLELNQKRYAEEALQGLHGPKKRQKVMNRGTLLQGVEPLS